ncbi:MAG: threonine synthase [Terriglobia bacterium]
MNRWLGIMDAYRDFLPVTESTPVCSLNEGNTPLIYSPTFSDQLGIKLFFKCEGYNPTCSFKDRGLTMAVSKALEKGANSIICASTGNTSASAAAYAARSGLQCIVVIPGGKVALGKLLQALMHGARVVGIDAGFDEALKIVRAIVDSHASLTLVNSLNPFRIEGQKTAAFEVCDQLGEAPDYLAIPVGNAGNITSYWRGFREYYGKKTKVLPRMIGFQAEGAAPIVRGYPIDKPQTVATAIRIGNPARWEEAESAAMESEGGIYMVDDEDILRAYGGVAREGLFVEPASAISIAGVINLVQERKISKNATVVAVLTGHGLKDPETAQHRVGDRIEQVEASTAAVEKVIFSKPAKR